MTRHRQLAAVLLSVGLAPVFAWAQEPFDLPAPPPQERPRDVNEDEDNDRDEPRRDMDEARRQMDEQRRDMDQQRREVDRQRREGDGQRRQGDRQRRQVRELIQRVPRFSFSGEEISPDSAWLGIQLTPVPAALAYHLHLEDKGVMVANLYKGSPAEKAGLDRYDVIVAADGKPIAGGPEAARKFSENVRDKRPGQPLDLLVINHGKEKPIHVELGPLPHDWPAMRPKYDEDPDVAVQREFGLRGRIMRPGPNGGWITEDLNEFPVFRDYLDRNLRGQLEGPPEAKDRPAEGNRPGRMQEAIRVDKDGMTLQVHRDPNGHITVRRYKTGQQPDKDPASYDNMDQLRQADREACDLLESAGPCYPDQPETPLPSLPGQPPVPPGARLRLFTEKAPSPDGDRDQARREWESRFFRGPLKELKGREVPAPPKTSFEVTPDGKIVAHVRQVDAEMTRTFNSPEELRDKAPGLYKQYRELENTMK